MIIAHIRFKSHAVQRHHSDPWQYHCPLPAFQLLIACCFLPVRAVASSKLALTYRFHAIKTYLKLPKNLRGFGRCITD